MKKLSLALAGLFLLLTAFIGRDNQKEKFQAFLTEIDTVVLPYEITISDLAPKGDDQEIRMDYDKMDTYREFIPELKTGMFSRMGPPAIELLAKMAISEEVTGVIYAAHHRFRYFGASYMLALYDQNGNLLDNEGKKQPKSKKNKGFFREDAPRSFLLAFQTYEDAQIAIIDPEGQISIQYLSNTWEKEVAEYGIEDNKVIGHELVRMETFQLNPNGEISKLKLPVAKDARASLN